MDVSVPIRRMEQGFYLFGTRKIYAKVLNNKLVVRVGGGYMHIDEFIHQYTPLEVDKIERTDVIERFSMKQKIQKISTQGAERAVETSPIRSPRKPQSPERNQKGFSSPSRVKNQISPLKKSFQGSPKKSDPFASPKKSPKRKGTVGSKQG